MAVKEIPLRAFLNTQIDPEDLDINGCLVLDNFELDKLGVLKLRKGKEIKLFLNDIKCQELERCKTKQFGSFFIGYDKVTKKLFRIRKL